MNYLKKIRSLGFRKIKPIILNSYKGSEHGYYIIRVSRAKKEYDLSKNQDYYPRIEFCRLEYINIKSFELVLNSEISLFLIVMNEKEFIFFISDSSIEIIQTQTGIYHKNIYNTYNGELKENFWDKILVSLDKRVKRELSIRKILK